MQPRVLCLPCFVYTLVGSDTCITAVAYAAPASSPGCNSLIISMKEWHLPGAVCLVLFLTGILCFSRLQVLNNDSIYEGLAFAPGCNSDRQVVHVHKTHVRAAGLPYIGTQGQLRIHHNDRGLVHALVAGMPTQLEPRCGPLTLGACGAWMAAAATQ